MVIVPVSVLGQTPSAILHTQGGVWINGYEAPDSSAVFAGDLIETKTGFSANLTLDGSSVVIQQESVGKFQGDSLVLEHGSVFVGTSKSFKVRVNCITVVPVLNEWTQYEVTDVNRTVQVAARKLDVNVEHAMGERKTPTEAENSHEASVHESEQKNYDESTLCGAPAEPTKAGSSLSPKWKIGAGVGAAGGGVLLCILLCGGGGKKSPISPASP